MAEDEGNVGCGSLLWVFIIHWYVGGLFLEWPWWVLLPGMYISLLAAMAMGGLLEYLVGKTWAPLTGAILCSGIAFGLLAHQALNYRSEMSAASEISTKGVRFTWTRSRRVMSAKLLNPLLGDEAISGLHPFSQIRIVDAGFSSVSNQGLAHLERLPWLREVDLSYTGINDEGLERLSRLDHLKTLNLEGTDVTDAGIKHLVNCPILRKLNLSNTLITPDAIETLKKMSSLSVLDVKDCEGSAYQWQSLLDVHKELKLSN